MVAFDNRYELPCRTYFSQTDLPELYTQVRDKVRAELTSITYFASTRDFWSSDLD